MKGNAVPFHSEVKRALNTPKRRTEAPHMAFIEHYDHIKFRCHIGNDYVEAWKFRYSAQSVGINQNTITMQKINCCNASKTDDRSIINKVSIILSFSSIPGQTIVALSAITFAF